MAAFPAPSDYRVVDDMVLEYFVHRGFTRSFRALATDQQHDRTRSFDVGRVVVDWPRNRPRSRGSRRSRVDGTEP